MTLLNTFLPGFNNYNRIDIVNINLKKLVVRNRNITNCGKDIK